MNREKNDSIVKCGEIGLPPYIKRKIENHDSENYQTIYSKIQGSISATTAGLHFTDQPIKNFRLKGVLIDYMISHIGLGIFRLKFLSFKTTLYTGSFLR